MIQWFLAITGMLAACVILLVPALFYPAGIYGAFCFVSLWLLGDPY